MAAVRGTRQANLASWVLRCPFGHAPGSIETCEDGSIYCRGCGNVRWTEAVDWSEWGEADPRTILEETGVDVHPEQEVARKVGNNDGIFHIFEPGSDQPQCPHVSADDVTRVERGALFDDSRVCIGGLGDNGGGR